MPRRGHARCTCLVEPRPDGSDTEDVSSDSNRTSMNHVANNNSNFKKALVVHIFVRPSDNRARILCENVKTSGSAWYSCMPLNRLRLRRSRSIIVLYNRVTGSNVLTRWLSLPFSTMEGMRYIWKSILGRTNTPRTDFVSWHMYCSSFARYTQACGICRYGRPWAARREVSFCGVCEYPRTRSKADLGA